MHHKNDHYYHNSITTFAKRSRKRNFRTLKRRVRIGNLPFPNQRKHHASINYISSNDQSGNDDLISEIM